jgi:hypothetical protein
LKWIVIVFFSGCLELTLLLDPGQAKSPIERNHVDSFEAIAGNTLDLDVHIDR